MFSKAGAAAHAADMFPKMYVDAVIIGIIAYFGFKLMFYITAEWRKFRQEDK